MGPGEPELIHICLPFNKHHRNSSQLGPIQSGLDSDAQHLIHIQLNNEQKWAKAVGFSEEGKTVQMQTANGETFSMKTEGQDTTSGYPTLREAIQRTSPTLVRISQLTEPNRVYGTEVKRQGRRQIGWAQAIYPLRARLQELKNNVLSDKWDEVLEDK